MKEKVMKLGLKRERGFLYYINDEGDVCRAKLTSGGRDPNSADQVVAKAGIIKADGYLYFIDNEGDISRSPSQS